MTRQFPFNLSASTRQTKRWNMKLPFMVIFFACTLVGLGAAMPRSFRRDWYEREDWSGEGRSLETKMGMLVELRLYVHPRDNDHYLTTSGGPTGWDYKGVVGLVFPTPQDETAPLTRYISGRVGNRHYGTTKLPDFGDGDMKYLADEVVGYVYPLPRAGTVPLYQWYDKDNRKSHIVSPKREGLMYAGGPMVLAYIFPK